MGLMMIKTLRELAEKLNGSIYLDEFQPYIRIDTGDNTSKENYDALLDMRSSGEIPDEVGIFKLDEFWADHDTQIIEYVRKDGKHASYEDFDLSE